MNLAQLLARSAGAWPHLPALAIGGYVTCDYARLAERVARLAGGFRRLGLEPGDRVALVMKNSAAYVEILFGCWHAGLAAVPINSKLHPRELEFIFADTGAKACFVSEELASGVAAAQPAAPALAHVIEISSPDFAALFRNPPLPMVPADPGDLAWLFYTSGTTGRPKGVMLTHGNMRAMTMAYFCDVDAIAPGDSIVHAAPMSHGSGMYVLPHVAAAALNVAPESGGFEPDEIFRLLRRHRGVTMFAAPTMVKRLVAHAQVHGTRRLRLKTLVYGGGPMYVEDCKAALDAFGQRLAQIYGQGESPMTITALSKALHGDTKNPRYEARLASVGVAHTGMELRIAGEDGKPRPVGETGEVLVRGPTVMAGYLNNREASEAALRAGWLHTGDVGSMDADGFLTLRDRSKDLIISGGSNIYPREIEEVLLRHRDVAEVSVVGAPDPEWGESVVAFVVPRGEARVDAAALDALCLEHIARFKRPKRYEFIDELPKNQTGKVLKTELRARLAPKR